jgi:two-component system response regulator DesR
MRDILIVEDHPFVAEATRALLEKSSAVREVVTVGTAEAAVAVIACDISRWRLILLDLDIPGAVGLSLVRQIKDLGLAPITCVLTGIDRKDYVAQVRRQGFLGYVLKAARTSQLDEALSSVLFCKPTFPASHGIEDADTRHAALTRRQAEILQFVGEGKTSKEIGRILNLSPGTVDNHIAASIAALGTKTRSEAVQRALMLGFIRGTPSS